jgi:hypothetical protein
MLIQKYKCETFPPEPSDRTLGIHLSDIYSDIASSSGIDNFTKDPNAGPNVRMEMGFIWERTLEAEFKKRAMQPDPTGPEVIRPGEIVVEGIPMSPDGICLDPWKLMEYKLTWMSSNRDPLDNWRWVTQMKGYLYGVSTFFERETVRADLHVLYGNGDYKHSGPEYWCYELEFTKQEIYETWAMLKKHAQNRGWI